MARSGTQSSGSGRRGAWGEERGEATAASENIIAQGEFRQHRVTPWRRSQSPHLPNVLPKYSTITFTSASEACAPRATMPCTTAFQSFSFIRWLVTTSTEWQPVPQVFSTNAFAPPFGSSTGANAPTFGNPRLAAAAAATAFETETGNGFRGTSGSANATRLLLSPPPRNAPPPSAIRDTYCRPSRPI